MKNTRGFTIIELMIVVGIIGVIASIAIPTYRDYMTRAKVAEAVNLLGGLKNPMVEYYHSIGTWTSIANVGGKTSGRYTSLIKPGGPNVGDGSSVPNGITFFWIEATMKDELMGKKLRSRYILTDGTDSFGDWDCTTDGTSNPVPNKFLPNSCR